MLGKFIKLRVSRSMVIQEMATQLAPHLTRILPHSRGFDDDFSRVILFFHIKTDNQFSEGIKNVG